MHSKWITYMDCRIFYQDFSNHNQIDPEAVKQELAEVESIVLQEPLNTVLVLADFRETHIGKELMDLLVASSRVTQAHVKKTAAIGITGPKRILASMLTSLTGQPLSIFDRFDDAQKWLIQ